MHQEPDQELKHLKHLRRRLFAVNERMLKITSKYVRVLGRTEDTEKLYNDLLDIYGELK